MAETDLSAMNEIAQQVRAARTGLGVSQGLLAARAGVSRPPWRAWRPARMSAPIR